MTWKLIIWFAFILLEVWRNYYIIEVQKKHPNYLKSAGIRIVSGIAYLFLWPCHVVLLIDLCVFMLTSFWLWFPAVLNLSRGRELFYLGNKSGYLDPWFLKHPLQFRIALTLAAVLCVLSIIVIYQNG
jgi:hypothetical protein